MDKVIFRFDFDTVDLKKLGAFSGSISDRFPIQEQKEGHSASMEVEIKSGKVINHQDRAFKQWEYFTADKRKKLCIAPTYLYVEYIDRSYTDKSELLDDHKNIVSKFLSEFSIETINRLGLRYINRFDFNEVRGPIDWDKFFSKNLTATLKVARLTGGKTTRAMSQVEVKLDTENLRYTYGIWNSDYPSENTRNEFTLDIDCWSKFPHDPHADLTEVVSRYNKNAQNIFEKSITDSMRTLLRKKI